jgi:hypothetical protein
MQRALDNPANVTLEDGLRAIIRAGTSALHLESIDVDGPAGCARRPAAAGEAIPADSALDGSPEAPGRAIPVISL